MEILNDAPLGAAGATRFGTASSLMSMTGQGAGRALRMGSGSALMRIMTSGYAKLSGTSHASAMMRMTARFAFPRSKVIAPGFAPNVDDRRLLIATEVRSLVMAAENRIFVLEPDTDLTIAPGAARSF